MSARKRIQFPWRLIIASSFIMSVSMGFSILVLQGCSQRACKVYTTNPDGGDAGPTKVFDNRPCRGYACDESTLLCRTTCETDEHCDDGTPVPGSSLGLGGGIGVGGGTGVGNNNNNAKKVRHYVCRNKACVCNDANTPEAKALPCHTICEVNEDCNNRVNPSTGEALLVSKGYTCKKIEGQSNRVCTCTNTSLGCKVPKEPTPDTGGGFGEVAGEQPGGDLGVQDGEPFKTEGFGFPEEVRKPEEAPRPAEKVPDGGTSTEKVSPDGGKKE